MRLGSPNLVHSISHHFRPLSRQDISVKTDFYGGVCESVIPWTCVGLVLYSSLFYGWRIKKVWCLRGASEATSNIIGVGSIVIFVPGCRWEAIYTSNRSSGLTADSPLPVQLGGEMIIKVILASKLSVIYGKPTIKSQVQSILHFQRTLDNRPHSPWCGCMCSLVWSI